MDTHIRIAIACAIGSFIGAMVALSVATHLWWVGMLVGFATGYITYEFRVVITVTGQALAVVFKWRPDVIATIQKGVKFSFKFSLRAADYFIQLVLPITCAASSVAIGCIFCLWFMGAGDRSLNEAKWLLFICLSFVCTISLCVACMSAGFIETEEQKRDFIHSLQVGRKLNPIRAYFYLFPLASWRLVKEITQLVKGILLEIHSDIRLLCGFDAALGAAAGYFLGSSIAGGLIGAALGMINYEVVTKRILKLTPKHQ